MYYVYIHVHTPGRSPISFFAFRFFSIPCSPARSRSTTRHVRGAAVGCRLNRSLRTALVYRPERIRESPPSVVVVVVATLLPPAPPLFLSLLLPLSRRGYQLVPDLRLVFTDRTRSLDISRNLQEKSYGRRVERGKEDTQQRWRGRKIIHAPRRV